MKILNLCKVEGYRFVHSVTVFVFMMAGFLATLFLASDNSDALLSDGTPVGAVHAAMKITNLVIVLAASVAIGNYVGREFKQKTIHYELMQGYSLCKISVIKSVVCGILVPAMLELCILTFFMTIPEIIELFPSVNLFFMFLVLCHICSCTTLYIILCKDGSLGGCFAFVRFILIEVIGLFILKFFVTDGYYTYKPLFTMSQWSAVINADCVIPVNYMIWIICGGVLEYLLLIALIQFGSQKNDL